ncbi:MAG: guanylate kinase [Gemmatimonadota bacterium]|nr:MAG: guanylate kinase [Gemmatimonadota bacterium]
MATWLLDTDRDIVSSVSCTTRARRGQEVEGIDYFFIDEADFLARRDRNEFVEWALVHGNLYGTPASFLDRKVAGGKSVLLDIDVQGALQIRKSRADAVLVFLMPPSLEVLEERLRGRSTDSDHVIERRLAAARREMRTASAYDYVLVNHDLDGTREGVAAIVQAERCRASRVLHSRQVESEPILAEAGMDAPEGAQNLER